MGELWRELADDKKSVYEESAKKAKNRFAREMEAFKKGECLEEEEEDATMDDFDKLDAFLDVTIDMDESTRTLLTPAAKESTSESSVDTNVSLSSSSTKGTTPSPRSSSDEKDDDADADVDPFDKLDEFLDDTVVDEVAKEIGVIEDGTVAAQEDAFEKLDEFLNETGVTSISTKGQRECDASAGDAANAASAVDDRAADDNDFDAFEALDALL